MMRACLVLITCLIAGTAQAHEGTGAVGGFVSGFTHLLFGWDLSTLVDKCIQSLGGSNGVSVRRLQKGGYGF